MKNLIVTVLILMTLPMFVIGQAKNGQSKTEAEVRRADREFHNAFMMEDASVLQELLTNDFFWTHSTGNVQDKALIVANIKSGKLAYEIAETDDVNVHLYKNSAVVSGHATRRYPGKDTFWLRYTSVYVKIGGKWRAAAFHSSHVPN